MSSPRLPADAGIGSVTLRVGSLNEVLPFYRDTVGLAVMEQNDERAILGTGSAGLLRLEERPDLPTRPADVAGLFHLAIRVPDRDALADALDRIRGQSTLTGASDHLVSEALYLRDPEGNGVEIYRDRPREEWRTTGDGRVAMDTLPLDQSDLLERSTGADRLPSGTDIGHVHLEVTDLARSVAFYRDRLGMNVRDDGWDGAAFLAAGDYHHHIGLNTWNGRSSPLGESRGLVSFELVLPDEAALETLREALDADGVSIDPMTDPDGITIHLRTG